MPVVLDVGGAVDGDLDQAGARCQGVRAGRRGDSRRWWGRSKRAAACARCRRRGGVPSRASNSSRLSASVLGQEVEDAAAVVVDDDDADRGGDVAQGGEAADVVEEAEVAGDDRGRAAAGVRRRRCPEETRPSMPLAPRLQRKSASVSLGGEEGLLVADRHARGSPERSRRRHRAAARPAGALPEPRGSVAHPARPPLRRSARGRLSRRPADALGVERRPAVAGRDRRRASPAATAMRR